MTSTFLVCRRAGMQVLIPADDVLGVREMTVHQAPPTAPAWIAGVAVLDEAAVAVAHVDALAPASRRAEGRRVVVLQRQAGQAGELEGIVVDEVLELRALVCEVAADAADGWYRRTREPAHAVLVDPARLRAALQAGGTA